MIDFSKLATFKNEHLSVSRLKLYEQCALAFFHRYVNQAQKHAIDVAPRGEAAEFGTVLHATLELVYAWIVAEQYEGRFPEAEMIIFYRQAWQASGMKGVALYHEGLDILRAYARSTPLVDHWRILGVEVEFNLDLGGYIVNGYIDRIDKVDDETIEIIDYKSNRLLFTKSDLETDLQMSIYGLAARSLYPWAKQVRFKFRMLRHDLDQEVRRSARTIDDAAGYVVALGRMTETEVERAEKEKRQPWQPTLNENCAYCDYRRRCPKYAEAITGGLDYPKAENPADLVSVSVEREAVANIAKVAYGRRDELDDILKAAHKNSNLDEMLVGERKYRYIPAKETVYDADLVMRAFTDAGVSRETVEKRVLRTDAKEVEAMLEELLGGATHVRALALKAELQGIQRRVPMSPRWDSKPVRKAKTEETATKGRR